VKISAYAALVASLCWVLAAPRVSSGETAQSKRGGTDSSAEEAKTGMICVIANPPSDHWYANVPFDPETLMFRIDDGKRTPWPQKTGFKVDGLSLAEKHLVVVYSWGKPIQSFRFRFAEFQDTKLCLLFDGYSGPELRHMHKSCGCA
jgi:hypothetical protein